MHLDNPTLLKRNTPPTTQDLQHYTSLIFNFFEKAGAIAQEKQHTATPTVKKQNALVTEADLAISALAYNIFEDLCAQGHLIIEEETTQTPPSAALFNQHDIIWAIDPIDGTSAYSAKLPNYGISVGAIYKGTPLLGGVYLPQQNKLFFYDGKNQPYVIYNPFTPQAKKTPLTLLNALTQNSFFDLINNRPLEAYTFENLPCKLTMSNAMTAGLANTAAGALSGAYFHAFIWDFLGGWALLHGVGAKVYNLHSGAEVKKLGAHFFDQPHNKEVTNKTHTPQNWRFKDKYIACNPKFFKTLQAMFACKNKG